MTTRHRGGAHKIKGTGDLILRREHPEAEVVLRWRVRGRLDRNGMDRFCSHDGCW